jgi:hypothetical protein
MTDEPAPERSPFVDDGRESATVRPLSSVEMNEQPDGMEEDNAIEVDSEDRSSEADQPVVTGRAIAVSPLRQDILDRAPGAAVAVASAPPRTTAAVSPSPYRPPSSPRYRHGRRLLETDAAVPNAAGVTTEQADRYRMSRSSGKRFRSPAKPTSLWGDLCSSYIHQSGASDANRTTPSFSHKRQARSAAERTFGGSSVFRAPSADAYGWPRSESTRGERQPVLSGAGAMNVAHQAAREFLGERDVETKQSEPPMQLVPFEQVEVGRTAPSGRRSDASNYRRGKRVSFGGHSDAHVPSEDPAHPQPRTLPVLADKTTQTEAFLLSARKQPRPDRETGESTPVYCPACDTPMDEPERARKVPRGSAEAAPAQQRSFRRTSTHLTNPIMINPRYPPEPTAFRGRSTYSTEFIDRLPWR